MTVQPVATPRPTERPELAAIRAEVERGRRFLLTSHARPDGDSIGSQVAMALAFRALGKSFRILNADPPPDAFRGIPGVDLVEVAARAEGEYDACFVMECGDLSRPGVAGLERYRIVNVDHHLGNTGYGAVNWFDPTAAACGEMVLEIIDALAVPLSTEMAANLYLAIVTDTGSFRHAGVSARTFDCARRLVEAGVDASAMARQIFDQSSANRLRLTGAVLEAMRITGDGAVAVLAVDDALFARTGTTYEDTDGLINMPLGAREIRAVVMFKASAGGELRVSLRSKGAIDVRSVARRYGGGGHTNAAGFTAPRNDDATRDQIVADVVAVTR